MLKVLVFIYFVSVLVESENGRRRRDYEGRQPKLFSFKVLDDDVSIGLDFYIPFLRVQRKSVNIGSALEIDVQFSIPFIKIPVKKTMNSAYGMMDFPTININPASLALGGAVVLGTTIVVPFLFKQYANYHQEDFRYARLLNNAEFGADAMLDFAQQMFMNTHGFRGCPLRLACWAAQKEFTDPRVILNQIVNNKLLSSMVNSSAVEDAMISGMHGRSCSSYEPCPLQEHHLPMLMNNLAVLTNTPGNY